MARCPVDGGPTLAMPVLGDGRVLRALLPHSSSAEVKEEEEEEEKEKEEQEVLARFGRKYRPKGLPLFCSPPGRRKRKKRRKKALPRSSRVSGCRLRSIWILLGDGVQTVLIQRAAWFDSGYMCMCQSLWSSRCAHLVSGHLSTSPCL